MEISNKPITDCENEDGGDETQLVGFRLFWEEFEA